MVTAKNIVEEALRLGYDKCGIVPLDRMAEYGQRLEERMERFPHTRPRYEKFLVFAAPQAQYPWAKAVVVCSFWYGKYRIPQGLQGRVAKYYLTDGRRNTRSTGYQASVGLERYLQKQGLRIAFDRDFGVTSLRWAAQEAGLGLIRSNNFFYTEKGSWQYLEAFLIDQPLEYLHQNTLRPCAPGCTLCRRGCPTQALDAPFSMDRNACISDLTTWSGWDLTREPLRAALGSWVYGCDACQDACPYNRNAWTNEAEFPGLEELSRQLSLVQIVEADYEFLCRVVQPALWYIPPDKLWRYKTNALNAMLNRFVPEYRPVIQAACKDEQEPVRRMAAWVLEQLEEQQ